MKNIAVILSGCGYKDGSEITEVVSTLINITQLKAQYQCFAPDMTIESTDHLTGESSGPRNLLSESARIARGKVRPLQELDPEQFDALVFPGGFGAALHLSDWANKGVKSKVLPEIVTVIKNFHTNSKPIGAICIAPVLLAKVLGDKEVTLTIGNDTETIQEIEKTGSIHEDCDVNDYITDRLNKIVTTPAYMFDEALPSEVFTGISNMLNELVEMA